MGGVCTVRCRGNWSFAAAASGLVRNNLGLPTTRFARPVRVARNRTLYSLHLDQLSGLPNLWTSASVRSGASMGRACLAYCCAARPWGECLTPGDSVLGLAGEGLEKCLDKGTRLLSEGLQASLRIRTGDNLQSE